MNFEEKEIDGVILIKPNIFEDDRGHFFERFNKKKFQDFLDQEIHFCQDNESFSKKSTIRGLHYQLEPYSQGKLVHVVDGEIYDVAVDIRKSSMTFGKYVGCFLSSDNKKSLWIPPGFAHGFCVTSKTAIVNYKCSGYYNPKFERSLNWNDKTINIDWPIFDSYIISKKDKSAPFLSSI